MSTRFEPRAPGSKTPHVSEGSPEKRPDWTATAEQRLLDAALPHVTRLGWSASLPARAAKDAGLSEGEALLLLPHGARDLVALLWRRHDRRAFETLAETDPASLKIRERIARGVEARVAAAMLDEEAVRRGTAWLARSDNSLLAARLGWATADAIWRWAGDTATDENHYSKRLILSGVLASVLAARLSRGEDAARETLDRRIGEVMAFEKWKAGLPRLSASAAASWLGALRYGAGR